MGNIWLALLPTIFAVAVFLGADIYFIITKPQYYIPKSIAMLCLMLILIYFSIPYLKDLTNPQTTIVVAEYEGFHRNSKVGTRKVIFIDDGKQCELFVAGYKGDVGKLQEGESYMIEYFNNSKIIKSYSLID